VIRRGSLGVVPWLLALGVVTWPLGACGADDPSEAAIDAAIDAPPGCTRPALDPAVIEPLVTATMTGLPGPRATTTERDAARAYLTSELDRMGWTAQLHSYAGGANVFATIPATTGTAPQIIVGAHFDTVAGSPGANDDASGVAVVLAVARVLADVPCRDAAVTVVLFDQEELGLFGSRAFAQRLSPADVRAVHTIDQVSWDADGDRRFELELPTPTLEAEWRAAATVIGVPVTTTSTTGTDHEAFRDQGFAAVGLTEEFVGGDTSPERHLPTDTVATVNTSYLVLAARLTAQVVIEETSP
jgi:hypothetical protein